MLSNIDLYKGYIDIAIFIFFANLVIGLLGATNWVHCCLGLSVNYSCVFQKLDTNSKSYLKI